MIIILEGLEGVGKSTVARAIEKSCGTPVYRAFRSNTTEHAGEGGQLANMLLDFGVPENTHVEDLYTADMLTTIGGDVTLDRSMPSAVAYGVADGLMDEKMGKRLFEYWMWRWTARRDVHYIHFQCDRHVASIRAPGRGEHDPDRMALIVAHLEYMRREVSTRFHTTTIDTSHGGIDGALEAVGKHLSMEITA